jgi:hypothetical protein
MVALEFVGGAWKSTTRLRRAAEYLGRAEVPVSEVQCVIHTRWLASV